MVNGRGQLREWKKNTPGGKKSLLAVLVMKLQSKTKVDCFYCLDVVWLCLAGVLISQMHCNPGGSVGVPQSDVDGQSEEHLMPVPPCCLVSLFAWSG